jgi:hypothetical protein
MGRVDQHRVRLAAIGIDTGMAIEIMKPAPGQIRPMRIPNRLLRTGRSPVAARMVLFQLSFKWGLPQKPRDNVFFFWALERWPAATISSRSFRENMN